MTNIKAYLVEGHGRSTVFDKAQPWAEEDPEYKVVPLVPMHLSSLYAEEFAQEEPLKEEAPSLPNTDDTQERIQLMNDLFELQEKEISLLKQKLEDFVELAEAIIEIAVPTDHLIENKAKLLLIHESSKKLLAPSE
jgi:hypothetical protein